MDGEPPTRKAIFDTSDEFFRRETWTKVLLDAKRIGSLAKEAQRKNTSTQEADEVQELARRILENSASLVSSFSQKRVRQVPDPTRRPTTPPAGEKAGATARKRHGRSQSDSSRTVSGGSGTQLLSAMALMASAAMPQPVGNFPPFSSSPSLLSSPPPAPPPSVPSTTASTSVLGAVASQQLQEELFQQQQQHHQQMPIQPLPVIPRVVVPSVFPPTAPSSSPTGFFPPPLPPPPESPRAASMQGAAQMAVDGPVMPPSDQLQQFFQQQQAFLQWQQLQAQAQAQAQAQQQGKCSIGFISH